MSQGPFRQPSINKLKGGLDKSGSVVAYSHKVSTTDYYVGIPFDNHYIMDGVNPDYQFPNFSHDAVDSQVPIPYLWMRSVRSFMSGFAHESFMDELAHRGGHDPLDFRLAYLSESPRYVAILERLVELTNWRSRTQRTGYGISIMTLRDSFVGQVAEVSRDSQGKIRLDKITAVVGLWSGGQP